MITARATLGAAVMCLALAGLALVSGWLNDSKLFIFVGGWLCGTGTMFVVVEILGGWNGRSDDSGW